MIKVFLKIDNIACAGFKVNGLSVLQRNILSLQQQGFAVFLDHSHCSPHLPEGVQGVSAKHFYQTTPAFLNLRADVQYSLGFFSEIKTAIEKNLSASLVFENQTRFPVQWVVSSDPHVRIVSLKSQFILPENEAEKNRIQTLEKVLFAEILKNTEGWIAKSINKKISFPISRWLVRTPVTPNQITFVCFVIGVLGCLMLLSLSWSTRVLGALLIQLSSILDGCDGEVARLKLKHSKIGAWMDTISDDVINNAMFVCLFLGLYWQTGNTLVLNYGVATSLASFWVSFALYKFLVKNNTPNAAHFRLSWDTGQAIQTDGLFNKIKPVLKRDFFIFVAMILIVFDQRETLLVLGSSVWGAFFLYLASTLFEIFKKPNRIVAPEISQIETGGVIS